MLTETNLCDDISDAELGLSNYFIFRKDRSRETSNKKWLGGVLLAVHKTVSCSFLPTTAPLEQVYVTIGSPKVKCILGCVYLPPESTIENYLMVSDTVDMISENYPEAEMCVAGDFNLPKARWINEDICAVGISSDEAYVSPQVTQKIAVISDLCAFHNLFQNNYIHNANRVLLDLVLSHNTFTVDSCDPLVPIDNHHPPLCFNLAIPQTCYTVVGPRAECYYYDFKSADFILINNYLAAFCWDNLLSNLDVDSMLNAFYEILYSCFDLFVPVKKVPSGKFPRWFSRDLINLTIQKKIAHKSYKNSKSAHDYEVFSNLRSQCAVLSRECYRNFVQNTENNLSTNSKPFWNFCNSKRITPELPNLLTLDNQTVNMGPDAANLFADYFSSVYSTCNIQYNEELSFNHLNVCNHTISICDIYMELISLNPHKGPGPDNVHPLFLKNCPFILARPLHLIFNKSLKSGSFPKFWKTSFVVPIHKSGDKSNIKNYRPICIINTIPKMFENLLTKYLSSQLSPEIIGQQFGFCVGRNTELNLLTYSQFILQALESGAEVHSVYTDFSKAFDKVPHNILISKLKTLGVNGSLLRWLESYLTDRIQVVKINNFLSNEITVPSGVPQGSHIGPLLFNVFINDIAPCIRSSELLLFADDLKMYKVISDPNDCIALQEDIHRFEAWCRCNGMHINSSKCSLMVFSRRTVKTNFQYLINGATLPAVVNVRDLGVVLDDKLSLSSHITSIIGKSLRMLGFIKRNSSDFVTVRSIKILYCSLVRSLLDYAASVWDPQYAFHIDRIERVQKKFMHYIHFKFYKDTEYNYEEMCHKLNISSLQERRSIHDLLLLFKILNSLVDCPYLTSSISLYIPPFNARNIPTFYLPYHRTNYGQNSFITRSMSLANQHQFLNFFCPLKSFQNQLSHGNVARM